MKNFNLRDPFLSPEWLPGSDDRLSLRQDISELCRTLRELLDSCADHEVTMDALVTAASPERYHEAREGVSQCISRIRASGATREYLATLVLDHACPCRSILEGIVEPLDLVPLMGGVLSNVEQDLVRQCCREWALAISPSAPEPLEEALFSAARPVTLADILSPEITRMQRFPTIVLLQAGGMDLPSYFWTRPGQEGWIPLPVGCVPKEYSAKVYKAIYCYLVQNHYLPHTFFTGTILQALEDGGVIRAVGIDTFREPDADDRPVHLALFDAGQDIREKEKIGDIRTLYRVAEGVLPLHGGREGERMHPDLERLGGHVLAGYLYGSRSTDAESFGTIGEDGENAPGFLGLIVGFIQEIASRPTGRAMPGPEQLRNLDSTLQEIRQLLNAITGDYCWRYHPFPGTDGAPFPVEVMPGQHLLLYDAEDLAYRDRDAALALAVEAYYRSRFGLRLPLDGIPEAFRPWVARLAAVTGNLRASRKGIAIHPGVAAWLEQLSSWESARPNALANQAQVARLPLPDRFLAAAIFEARYGATDEICADISIRHVLDATKQARDTLGDLQVSDEVCCAILLDEIWPACAPLFSQKSAGIGMAGQSDFASSPLHPGVVLLSATPGYGAQVPGPHAPRTTTAGTALSGPGSDLLDEEEYTIPVTASAGEPPGHPDQPGNGGPAPSGSPAPGAGSQPCREACESFKEIADQLLRTCQETGELIDTLASKTSPSRENEQDMLAKLSESARRLDELAASIEERVRQRAPDGFPGESPSCQRGAPGQPAGENWDTFLKISRDVRTAARRYHHTIKELDLMSGLPRSEPSGLGTRTGLPREALSTLREAGVEFQRLAGILSEAEDGEWRARIRLREDEEEEHNHNIRESPGIGRMDPSFAPEALASPELWESFSYFDAIYGEDHAEDGDDSDHYSAGRRNAEHHYEMGQRAMTREAEHYLATLKQRTRSEWETLDESAERFRQIALYEYLAVGQDDYALYQRFYQPVAGLIGVARKNIQQAFQKNHAAAELTELATGDDIDEENLAAVRTTMRIFKETGRQEDETRWTISLLVDASSSMHDETVSKKLDATLQAVILFGEAVSHIAGIRFEIAAFADSEYIPLKRYHDNWNIHQGCFLIRQVIQAAGGTNDVGAVSSALDRMARLRNAAGSNRMIFIISDGQSGVGGREQMSEVLARDPATRIFGWGIGPDMQMVEETYRPYGTWVPDIASLPRSLGDVLRRELGRPAMAGWKDGRQECGMVEDPCSS